MAFYTDQPIGNSTLSLLDAPATFGEAVGAAFDQSFSMAPVPLLDVATDMIEEEQGRYVYSPSRGYDQQVTKPTTPKLTKKDADERVKEAGFELDIPEDGIREGALDLLINRRREERERQIILSNAPSGSGPAVLAAQFAAQMVDPINLASAFIPVVGEARYSAMLAGAVGTAGRFGVRAARGAVEGAVGAAVVEPLVYGLSQQLQDDYDITDSLEAVLFGAVLGGGLRSVGGTIIDRIKAPRNLDEIADEIPDGARASFDAGLRADARIRLDMEEGRFTFEPEVAQIRAQAIADVTPAYRAELEAAATGRLPNVADLRREVAAMDRRIAELPDTFKDRAKAYQNEGMTRKEAETASRESIARESDDLLLRRKEAQDSLDGNRSGEMARSDLAALQRGEIPERMKSKIDAEVARVSEGFKRTKLAESVDPVPFAVKSELFHRTLASEMSGRPINPKAFIDIKSADPAVRQRAIDEIATAQTKLTRDYGKASERADAELKAAGQDDVATQAKLAEYDEATLREVADQTGYNLKDDPELKAAEQAQRDAEAYSDVYRANALCMVRN